MNAICNNAFQYQALQYYCLVAFRSMSASLVFILKVVKFTNWAKIVKIVLFNCLTGRMWRPFVGNMATLTECYPDCKAVLPALPGPIEMTIKTLSKMCQKTFALCPGSPEK